MPAAVQSGLAPGTPCRATFPIWSRDSSPSAVPQPGQLPAPASAAHPPLPRPLDTSLFSSIKQSLVSVPQERTSFPLQGMAEMEAPAFIMFRLVSEGRMPLLSLVTPWKAPNDVWGFYKWEILGFSSWYIFYKKLLSGSCKWLQEYQDFSTDILIKVIRWFF